MPKVGILTVDLELKTANFTGPLGKAGQDAQKAGKDIEKGFNEMDLGTAKGSLMVLDEQIGIHIPRHVTALISSLPGLGAALEMAFPVIAIIAVVKAISEFSEKLEKHAEAIEKAKNSMSELLVSTEDQTRALKIARLKVQDHIRALEGRPSVNGPKIAMEEAKIAADKLAESIQKDIDKEGELLKGQELTFLARLKPGTLGFSEDRIKADQEYAAKCKTLTQEIRLADTKEKKDELTAEQAILDRKWNERVEYERKVTDLALKTKKLDIFNPATGVTNTVDVGPMI